MPRADAKTAEPKVLLLQIRDTPPVRKEELASFSQYSGLPAEQIDVLNVFDTPRFEAAAVAGYDALFVGGASEASVLEPETYPFIAPCIQLLQHSIDIDIPVFASCFGFQLAVLALGGEIIRDQHDFEMGTPLISRTEIARSDPLFHDTPDVFAAVSVHKERAPTLPPDCDLLAYTQACPHAFRVRGKNFWAFQFHPEVDRATLIERLTAFRDHYTEGESHLSEVLASARETPESNVLLRKFVQRVVMPG